MALLSRLRASLAITVAALVLSAAPLFAQARVRVTGDQVNVWRPGFTVIAMVAQKGDVLDVVRRQGNWYEVILPGADWQRRETGFIAVTRVEAIDAAGAPTGEPARPAAPSQPARRSAPRQPPRASAGAPGSLRIFGDAGFGWFAAKDAFKAVLGDSSGPWYGGGLRYDMRNRYFVEGSVEHFQATGTRVFVLDDVVYNLGIKDKVAITPVMLTAGRSFGGPGYTSYVGAGGGTYVLRESSDFADSGDNVKQNKGALRALAGVQWPFAGQYALGFEVDYTTVPKGLKSGAAAAFDESNLGGLHLRVKILFGR